MNRILRAVCALVLGVTHFTASSQPTGAPPIGPDFGHTHMRSSIVLSTDDERVDPHLGSLRLTYVDMVLPGNGGLDIVVQRTYDSGRVAKDGFAHLPSYTPQPLGWTVHFGRVLVRRRTCSDIGVGNSTDDLPMLEMPDGSKRLGYFGTASGYRTFITPDRWSVECTDAGYLVISPNGTKYYMEYAAEVGWTNCYSPTGGWQSCVLGGFYTTKIVDVSGNTINIGYVAGCAKRKEPWDDGVCEPLITAVEANDGRSIAFTYEILQTPNDVKRKYLSRIDGPGGQVVRYEMQYLGNSIGVDAVALKRVTLPTGHAWSYEYFVPKYFTDPRCVIQITCEPDPWDMYMKQVTNLFGGVRTYAWTEITNLQPVKNPPSVGLASKTIAGAGGWSYSYFLDKSDNDYPKMVTTITGPSEKRIYHHLTDRYLGGPRNINPPEWRAGMLVYSEIVGKETSYFEWKGQPLSDSWASLVDDSWKWDGKFYASVLTKSRAVRDGVEYVEEHQDYDKFGRSLTTYSGPAAGPRKKATRTYWDAGTAWIHDRTTSETVELQ